MSQSVDLWVINHTLLLKPEQKRSENQTDKQLSQPELDQHPSIQEEPHVANA